MCKINAATGLTHNILRQHYIAQKLRHKVNEPLSHNTSVYACITERAPAPNHHDVRGTTYAPTLRRPNTALHHSDSNPLSDCAPRPPYVRT
eukprot:8782032-Heterocapsa_arctica.AAC.1